MMCPSGATCLSICELVFFSVSTIRIKLSVLFQCKADIISLNMICSRHDIDEKLLILAINSNHPLTPDTVVFMVLCECCFTSCVQFFSRIMETFR